MQNILIKVILPIIFISSISFASNIPMANVYGSQGIVLPQDKLKMGILTDTFTKNKAYNSDSEVLDKKQRNYKSTIIQYKIKYGIFYNIDITFIPTYIIKKSSSINPMNGKQYHLKNKGLGDTFILTKYQLTNQKNGNTLFTSIGLAIKFPTGDTSKEFDTPQGKQKIPTMQLGSGSTDFLIIYAGSKIIKKYNSRIDFATIYDYTTKGANEYQFGNKFIWNLGYSYAVTKKLDLQLELDGKHFAKNKDHGKDVDFTGGNFYYLTPGIHYKFNKKFNLSFAYAKMIKRDNNYDSATKTGGLSEDSRYSFRAVYSF